MLAFTCNVRGATPLGQPLLPGTDEPTAIPARDAVAPAVNPVARLRPRIFYGWWIVAGGFVIQGLNGGLLFHAFSAYILPLQAEFGWNRSLLSGAFSMAQAEGGILGPLQGWLIERFGPRGVMRVGLTVFGVGFLLFSRMDSIAMFYASFAMMAIGSGLGTFLPVATTITNWFRRRRATAIGIGMTGMGVGGLMVPLVVWSLTTHGWRTTSFVSGLIVLAVGLPMTQLMRRQPEDHGYLPDGAEAPANDDAESVREATRGAEDDPDFTLKQALRTPSFWLLSVGHAAALLVVGAAIVHQIPHMVEAIGLSEGTAAGIVSLLVGMNITGQLAGGYIGDRVDKRLAIVGCLLGHAAALLIFAFVTTFWGALAFAVLHGSAWGVRGPLIISVRADYFGRRSYATIMGFSSLIMMAGMTTGPLVAGFLRDATGTYSTAFVILAGLAASGSVAIFLARKPAPPSTRRPGPRLSGSGYSERQKSLQRARR